VKRWRNVQALFRELMTQQQQVRDFAVALHARARARRGDDNEPPLLICR